MMDYRCSECGGEVLVMSLTVDPPITRYLCRGCGRTRDERPEPHDPVTIDMCEVERGR